MAEPLASEPPSPDEVVAAPATARGRRKGGVPRPNLSHPSYYLNRELSWLEFDRRVLAIALDPATPLLERVRFLSIFASNLDEFFMVRVSGLRRQLETGVVSRPPDGMSPAEQLTAIRERLMPMRMALIECWALDLQPKLRDAGIQVLDWSELRSKQRKTLRKHFEREIFPTLTPLAFDPGHPFPHISNLSINLAVVVRDPLHGERFARLKVPGPFPRLIRIPGDDEAGQLGLEGDAAPRFVWIEEVIAANLDLLFPGLEVVAVHPFRVTRDADVEIEEDEAADLLTAMVEVVGQRHFGSAVRLEIEERTPQRIREILVRNLGLSPYQVFTTKSPIGRADLMQLTALDRPDLKFPPATPVVQAALTADEGPFAAIRRRDFAVYHPYDSFAPVVAFVEAAARDPEVLAIKQTLYRVGPNSPMVQALMRARESGKQVAVLVELKARFDEENNIELGPRPRQLRGARRLRRARAQDPRQGVPGGAARARRHPSLRPPGHRQLQPGNGPCLQRRRLLLCRPGARRGCLRLLQRPHRLLAQGATTASCWWRRDAMRDELLERIERETERQRRHGDGYLAFKMNALVDKACIKALYRASQAGVQVDLQVRGICCLRPGVPRVSETIRVTSIVGRFLEHSRLYYFRNGGDEELFLGSADLMPRNLDRRVEVLFPVSSPPLRAALRDGVLFAHLRDSAKAWQLLADGSYERVVPKDGEKSFNSQEWLLKQGGSWRLED